MKAVLSSNFFLWAVGVLQPTRPVEILLFQRLYYGKEEHPHLSIGELNELLQGNIRAGRLIRFKLDGKEYYSLSMKGNEYLSPKARLLRDKIRLFLLKNARRHRLKKSGGKIRGRLAGGSPASDTSTPLEECAANKLHWPWPTNKVYWPRLVKQLGSKTGSSEISSDAFFPRYFSFPTLRALARALSRDSDQIEFDCIGLGTCLGISPRLLSLIVYQPENYYRTFSLKKRGGGSRTIESPRVFLKTVQGFLLDFILSDLPIHGSVHSFRPGRSIVTNATNHERTNYVANIDIENFFGSITRGHISQLLSKNGFSKNEADLIAHLCTKDGHLPQGAPTSPLLSNAILFGFDFRMAAYCRRHKLNYTRYADDITISGDAHGNVMRAIDLAGRTLEEHFDLHLKKSKTRVASFASQQRVTGIVVNKRAAPPREYRRRIRAIFHQASLQPAQFADRLVELGGYIGYLQNFPKFAASMLITEYKLVVRQIREAAVEGRPAAG